MAETEERARLIQRLSRPLLVVPVLVLVAVVLLALGLSLARRGGPGGPFGVNIAGRLGSLPGSTAADFTLALYNGTTLRLDDVRGQAVVLNFWASWCVPCRDEAPLLAKVARENRQRGVAFIGIGVWDAESDAAAFLDRYGVDYPNGADVGGRIAIEYGLTGLPETYFVRPDGTLSRRWIGPITETQLRTFIDEIRPGS